MIRIIEFVVLMLISQQGWSFGSATILGMQNEHARITRAALSCDSTYDPLTKPSPCFEPKTMSNLGGEAPGAFPAVESPDNIALHFSGGPDWWHCDKADYISDTSYPQPRNAANTKLSECRTWAQSVLGAGLASNNKLCSQSGAKSHRCTGVAALSHLMLDTSSMVDVSQPDYFSLGSGCAFNGNSGRIKCEIIQQFGYALHVLQDFYSHSNYSDYNSTIPLTWTNPPGLFNSSLPEYWDMVERNTPAVPDSKLSTGCYPNEECFTQSRVTHDQLNKDKATIDPVSGRVIDTRTQRASILYAGQSNGQRAVAIAIAQTRAAWNDLQTLIIQREGKIRGEKIICAIASDNPNNCGKDRSAKSARSMEAGLDKMPQGEIPEPTKIEPFDWAQREYAAQAQDRAKPADYRLRSRSQSFAGGTVGISNPNSVSCGNRTILQVAGIPDDDRKLTAYDLVVSNISCAKASTKLHKYYLFNSGSKTNAARPDIQCLVMSDQVPTGEDPNARIVCKNQDASVEMSFEPDCANGSQDGECGL